MYKYGEEHPVIFEILLLIAAFAVAAVFNIVGYIFNLHPDISNSAARILTAIALLVIYKRAYRGNHFFDNLVIVLPALLFPAWNIFYYLSSGIAFGGANFFIEGAITAIAPALFEEVLFRMIFIYNLKKKGSSDLQCVLISSALFAATHLTNLAGMKPASVMVQTVYSFVIGLVLAAIYVKNESLLQVIAVHFLIDLTTRIFMEHPSYASPMQLVVFVLVLAVEAAYALWLTVKRPGSGETK